MKKEDIVCNKEIVATIMYAENIEPGVHFYSEGDNSLQVGKQLRAKGEKISPHRHLTVKIRREETLQEVLYIEKGKVRITFYDDQSKAFDHRILNRGDMILLKKGGHSFEMLEETVMVEIKQGPYDPQSTQKFEEK